MMKVYYRAYSFGMLLMALALSVHADSDVAQVIVLAAAAILGALWELMEVIKK